MAYAEIIEIMDLPPGQKERSMFTLGLRQGWFSEGKVFRDHKITTAANANASPKTTSRRVRLEMPRSSSIVRANEQPRKWRLSVERTIHQPAACSQGWRRMIGKYQPGRNAT